MFVAYIVLSILTAAANIFSATLDFIRYEPILINMEKAKVPKSWLPILGILKAAGALGLLLGISQKRAPPSFLISGGVFTQLDVFISKFPSFCNSRYCSSVRSSMPMAAAISIALSSGLCSFLDSSASRS